MIEGKPIILVITPTLECGGAERFVSLFCNNVNLQFFEIKLAVVNNTNPFFKIRPEVEILDLKAKHVRNIFSSLNRLMNELKPDVVFTTANHLNLFVAITRGLYNHKPKWLARESSIVTHNSKQAKLPVLYNFLLKKFYYRLDMVICQSVAMQQDLIENYNLRPSSSVVIANGVEVVDPGEPSDDITFLTVARLSEEKGVGRILDCLAQLKFPFKYFIAGDGPLRSALEAKSEELNLKDRVQFLGRINDPFRYYSFIRLYLAGSFYEGYPNAILEANAAGIPVIAFNVPGIRDVVNDSENGFLVKDNDLAGFAGAIEKGIKFSFNREKIREQTICNHSVAGMTAQIENVIKEIILNP